MEAYGSMEVLMVNPLVSAVITTHNLENYVREGLQAAFSQTYSPLEIVIVDDCSTDNTWRIITDEVDKYRRMHTNDGHAIICQQNVENLGMLRNFERAFSLAHGEIMVEMDGDDISRPNRVQRVVEEFNKNPNLRCVVCGGVTIDSHNRQNGRFFANCWVPLGAAMAYRLEGWNGWPSVDSRAYQDWVIMFRSMMTGDVSEINEDLMKYRVGTGSSTSRYRKRLSRSHLCYERALNQVLVDLDYKSKHLDGELHGKIHQYISQLHIATVNELILYSSLDFHKRYKALKFIAKRDWARYGYCRFGGWMLLLWNVSMLLPPGKLDFIPDLLSSLRSIFRTVKNIFSSHLFRSGF